MEYLEIRKIVRRLRRKMTPSEKILWEVLRNRKLCGVKFNRQHPIFYESVKNDHFFYVADFYCHEHKLVVELDGSVHDYQQEKDYNRDLILIETGLKVLHIRNEELRNMTKVKNKILNS
jgi:very-short-patch-repair endonuclease